MSPDSLAGSDAGIDAGTIGQHTISAVQLRGLTCLLIGMAQLPLAFRVADITGQSIVLWVMLSAGVVLSRIGSNLLRGLEPFELEWTERERYEYLEAAFLVLLSMIVVVASLAASV